MRSVSSVQFNTVLVISWIFLASGVTLLYVRPEMSIDTGHH